MAADSQATDGCIKSRVRKIFRIDNHIIGCAGSFQDITLFLDWYRDRSKKKPRVRDLSVLVLSEEGITEYADALVEMPVLDEFYAVGSGAQAALAAMHLGHHPKAAVETASKIDPYTSGPFHVMRLDDPED